MMCHMTYSCDCRRLTEIEKMLTDAEDKQRQITDQSNADNHVKNQQIQQLKSEHERVKVTGLSLESRLYAIDALVGYPVWMQWTNYRWLKWKELVLGDGVLGLLECFLYWLFRRWYVGINILSQDRPVAYICLYIFIAVRLNFTYLCDALLRQFGLVKFSL